MKRFALVLIALILLAGCGGKTAAPQVQLDARAEATKAPADAPQVTAEPTEAPAPTDEPAPADVPGATDVPPEAAEEPAPPEGLADRLTARWEAEGLLVDLYPMEDMDVLDLYGIDFAACISGAAFGDAAGYTNEAVIVEAEGAVLDEAEALLRDHLDAVKAQFRDYDPEALALAEKAVLIREGNALLFVISPSADAMLAAFRAMTA